MYPAYTHWAHWSHLLSVLPMYPAYAWWIFGSLSPVSSSRGGDLNPNRCCDRGETFGHLEGPGRTEVVGASMVMSASGPWAPGCVATRFFVRASRVGGGICRVHEIDGVCDIRAIGSCTETTRNSAKMVSLSKLPPLSSSLLSRCDENLGRTGAALAGCLAMVTPTGVAMW